ncbi:MAG: sigma-70 family RNA polymerase sigma factor [Planctomycetes bacterium]|nr:sigma-70 family RNA polymerase sigma factor [Planctomycetota bacterium]
MSAPSADEPLAGIRLDQLSTHVATLEDAQRFVFRYGAAIRGYLNAILRDPSAAEEVMQELILALLRRGGADTWPGKGRFRDYLKTAARNAAITYLRKKGRQPVAAELDAHADPNSGDAAAERAMTSEWQACVLARVWRELESHERRSPGNLFYTALQIVTEFQDADSTRHAQTASARTKRPITPEAFRKQVSRARLKMAELILLEVAGSIAAPTADDVEGELRELGLWGYVADYLPDDWRKKYFGR